MRGSRLFQGNLLESLHSTVDAGHEKEPDARRAAALSSVPARPTDLWSPGWLDFPCREVLSNHTYSLSGPADFAFSFDCRLAGLGCDEQVALQIDVAKKAGVAGFLVAYAEIEQGWQPRILKWK